jgi:hypothetical protein
MHDAGTAASICMVDCLKWRPSTLRAGMLRSVHAELGIAFANAAGGI